MAPIHLIKPDAGMHEHPAPTPAAQYFALCHCPRIIKHPQHEDLQWRLLAGRLAVNASEGDGVEIELCAF
jgi:hypothetical protein